MHPNSGKFVKENYRDAKMVRTSPLENVKSPSCCAVKASSVTNFFFVVIFGTLHILTLIHTSYTLTDQ